MNISINEQKTKSEPQYFITIFAVSCDNISCDNIESISSQSAFPSVTRLQFKFPPKLRYRSKTFATFCTKQIGVMMRAIKKYWENDDSDNSDKMRLECWFCIGGGINVKVQMTQKEMSLPKISSVLKWWPRISSNTEKYNEKEKPQKKLASKKIKKVCGFYLDFRSTEQNRDFTLRKNGMKTESF